MFSHYVPSLDQATVLDRAALGRSGLGRGGLVELLAGLQRQRAWLDSEEQHVLAALAAAPPQVWERDLSTLRGGGCVRRWGVRCGSVPGPRRCAWTPLPWR